MNEERWAALAPWAPAGGEKGSEEFQWDSGCCLA